VILDVSFRESSGKGSSMFVFSGFLKKKEKRVHKWLRGKGGDIEFHLGRFGKGKFEMKLFFLLFLILLTLKTSIKLKSN
jgi:hypothetical protein